MHNLVTTKRHTCNSKILMTLMTYIVFILTPKIYLLCNYNKIYHFAHRRAH